MGGAETSAPGHFYLDQVQLIGEGGPSLAGGSFDPAPSYLPGLTVQKGMISAECFTLNGRCVARRSFKVAGEGGHTIAASFLASRQALPAGTYLVRLTGAGLDPTWMFVK